MLIFATKFPNPTLFQTRAFMTALSLSAGGIGAVLPGFVEIRYKGALRAGGALAPFAVVWFSQLVIERNVVDLQEPTKKPESSINEFFAALDAGNISETYRVLDTERKSQITEQIWQQLYEANVKPLGAVTSRKLLGVDGAKAPPNLPIGIYRSETFATKYSDIPGCGAENVTAKATQNNSWTVYSYLIASSDMPCPTGM